jgi:hypothetical protein
MERCTAAQTENAKGQESEDDSPNLGERRGHLVMGDSHLLHHADYRAGHRGGGMKWPEADTS